LRRGRGRKPGYSNCRLAAFENHACQGQIENGRDRIDVVALEERVCGEPLLAGRTIGAAEVEQRHDVTSVELDGAGPVVHGPC
jgi:hypothetical protein